ncbi:hypothetical protein [Plantactinospora sp. B5E13]|uniref:hypothetical protein n=1 Tax=unclassified Plantactinospora TaxID=2631981 RepID=UPI00325DF559
MTAARCRAGAVDPASARRIVEEFLAAPTRLARLTAAWRRHEPDTPLSTWW